MGFFGVKAVAFGTSELNARVSGGLFLFEAVGASALPERIDPKYYRIFVSDWQAS